MTESRHFPIAADITAAGDKNSIRAGIDTFQRARGKPTGRAEGRKRSKRERRENGDVPTTATLQHFSSIGFYNRLFNLRDSLAPFLLLCSLHCSRFLSFNFD